MATSRDTPGRPSLDFADAAVRSEVGGSDPTRPVRGMALSNTDLGLCTSPVVGTKPVHCAGRPEPREISNFSTGVRPRRQADRAKLGSQGRVRSSPRGAACEKSSPESFTFKRQKHVVSADQNIAIGEAYHGAHVRLQAMAAGWEIFSTCNQLTEFIATSQ